jgi:hypothetical protein
MDTHGQQYNTTIYNINFELGHAAVINWLTPWDSFHFPIFSHLVRILSVLYRTRRFFGVFTRVLHWSLPWVTWTLLRFILILSFHRCAISVLLNICTLVRNALNFYWCVTCFLISGISVLSIYRHQLTFLSCYFLPRRIIDCVSTNCCCVEKYTGNNL